jgi:phosphate acetyltransferase
MNIVDFVQMLLESLESRGCDVLAMIANRVAPDQMDGVTEQLNQAFSDRALTYVLPEQALLARPTVAEVARALKAETVIGEAESFAREVGD